MAQEYMKAIDVKSTYTESHDVPASAMFINDKMEKPKPKDSQALIRIKAFGLNRLDIMQRNNNYPLPPQAPKTMGVEFSGVIVELGDQSNNKYSTREHFDVDDEVFGLAYGGAYAEYIVVSTHMLIRKPKELSWTEVACIPETWITATQVLYLVGEFSKGKSVLWHAGASNVCIAGIQLAKEDGAAGIFATVRHDAKVKFCEDLGCTKAFNSTKDDWVKEIKDATNGNGVDLVVDLIGGPLFSKNLDVLAKEGVMVVLATMGGGEVPDTVDLGTVLFKRVAIKGTTLRARDEVYQGKLRDMLVDHALPKFQSGVFKVPIEKEMDWSEIAKAHEMIESNEIKGKIVCTIAWD